MIEDLVVYCIYFEYGEVVVVDYYVCYCLCVCVVVEFVLVEGIEG